MIIDHQLKLVIIHIPKCAGKALRTAFNPDNPDGKFWHWSYNKDLNEWVDMAHLRLDQLYRLPEWELIEKYTVIAIVRNPIQRFFSALREHKKQHNQQYKPDDDLLNVLDETRVNHDPRFIHFCPQSRYIFLGRKRKVDYIAHQESLKNDLINIGFKSDMPKDFFDIVNLISEPPEDIKISNDELLKYSDLILRLYKDDFFNFGYGFPESKENSIFPRQSNSFEFLTLSPKGDVDLLNNEWSAPAYKRFEERCNEQKKIVDLQEQLSILQEKLIIFQKQNEVLIGKNQQIENDYSNILSSTCWKITRPLRILKSIFK